jgi:CsoR family transcriptional regulator, copper-sensing transcriptional repressor
MPATRRTEGKVPQNAPLSDKAQLLKRLNRVEGQVRGIARMVEQDRYCIDIITQVSAVRSALDAMALELLRSHAHGCIQNAVTSGKGSAAIDELIAVVEKFTR